MAMNRLFIFDPETKDAICIGKGYSTSWLTGRLYIDAWMDEHPEFTGDIRKTRFTLLTEQEITGDMAITWETAPEQKPEQKIDNKMKSGTEELNAGLGAYKPHDISEYDSTQWWYEELGKIFSLPVSEHVTADMKRAANVARNLMLAVEENRKQVPSVELSGREND